jgi:hypothetical protein
MSQYKNCTVCGKQFKFCGQCKRVSFDDLWRNVYCSEDCRDIFKTCSKYIGKSITIKDAYNALIKSNVKEKNLQMSVKNTVDEIMEYREPKPVTETKDEESIVIEELPKPKRRPRRRRSKNNEE